MRLIDKVRDLCVKYPMSFRPTSAAELAARLFMTAGAIHSTENEKHKDLSIFMLVSAYVAGTITANHKHKTNKYVIDADYDNDINYYNELFDLAYMHYTGDSTPPPIRLAIPDPALLKDEAFSIHNAIIEYTGFCALRGHKLDTIAKAVKAFGFNVKLKSFINYGIKDSKDVLIRFVFYSLKFGAEKYPEPSNNYWYTIATVAWHRYLFVTRPLIRKSLKNAMEKNK